MFRSFLSVRKVSLVVTALMVVVMGSGAIFDLVRSDEVVTLFVDDLGYPDYFPRFVGFMKLLGVLAVIVPRFRRLTEWAYAGLTFDVIGALYSHQAVGSPTSDWLLAGVALVLVLASYALFSIQNPLNSSEDLDHAVT